MATPIMMPRQGQSVESCILTKWNKKKGDAVAIGDILFSYETDKASFEEESPVAGTLLDIFFEEGEDVPVLTHVCVIGKPGESTEEFKSKAFIDTSYKKAGPEMPQNTGTSEGLNGSSAPVPAAVFNNEELKISPRAKNAALRASTDFRLANASGPDGRIIERDIVQMIDRGLVMTPSAKADSRGQAVQGSGAGGRIRTDDLIDITPSASAEFTDLPLTNIRKVIAKAMHHSLASSAQLTLNSSFDATDILSFRKKLKENREKLSLPNITINDIILYAVSRTLLKHPAINAHFLDDKIRQFGHAHVGIAMDTERGLMVPTLFNADLLSLAEISIGSKKLGEECRKGTINPDLLKSGTFTVTNLGTLDIESFTPVLNPPQAGILGVCSIIQRVRTENGVLTAYPAMGLSLTFDHRALDGAPAAKFLQDLKKTLESFSILPAQ